METYARQRIAQLPPVRRHVHRTGPADAAGTRYARVPRHRSDRLHQVRAATVQPGTSLAKAEQIMIHQGVRLLFVVSQVPNVDGIVTATDLQGENPLMRVNQR